MISRPLMHLLTRGISIALLGPTATALQVSSPPDEQSGPEHVEQEAHPDRPLGGPESPSQRVKVDGNQESIYQFDNFQRWASPYFDWKKRMSSEHGLSMGFSAHLLTQGASDTLSGSDGGFGGIYRFQGSWVAYARDSGHPGRLEWRVENRSAVGGSQAPSPLGGDIGAAALSPGFGYSDGFDTDLSVLNWTQGFNDQTAGFAIGRLSFDVYQDAFLFQTFSRGFLNRAFLLSPTIGTTGIGSLGAVAKGFVSDNVWVGGQVYDANAVNGEFDLDTVGEGEFLKNVEIGWTPSLDRYKTDRIQFTYWEKDARSAAGAPSGQGWVVSASKQWTDRLIPFTRFGHSSGGAGVAAETAASVGLEYTVRKDQAFSFGVGWAEPSEMTFGSGLSDEWVLETSYKLQLSPNFSLTPDFQYLKNPANNPGEDNVWILGLRAIITF